MNQVRAADEISTGELLDGRYRLEARIGEGGMARVYRAEDTVLKRTVAIKVLRTPVDGLASLERAKSETTLLASLNHHGLVTLFDARITAEDDAYLVMEYVEGITLRERIAESPLPSSEAASLTVDLAEALHVAHTAGIVHRDIKPSNVLLWRSPLPGREWRAKLADFGIAHLLDSQRVTTPGLVVGTVAYIAPEQARGATPAPSADIYALGIMLIEAISGTRPYAQAEGFGAVMARLANPPEVPDSLGEEWQHLLRWMTAMHPEDRPTALEVAIAASRIVSPPIPVPPMIDEPTVAATVTTAALPHAVSIDAGDSTASVPATGPTVIFPSDPDVPARAPSSPPADPPRRRGLITAIVLGALLVGAAAFGLLWPAISLSTVPEPVPSQQVEEPVEEPVVEEPAVVDPAPVDTEDGDNSGSGNEDSGNDNSGPGNNNGNDKGGGKGKGGKD